MISVFENLKSVSKPNHRSVEYVLDLFKTDKYKIEFARGTEEFNEFKKELPIACFGGQFSHRSSTSLIQASGLIVLDFDKVKDINGKKNDLRDCKYVYSAFISPSGTGLKALIKIPVVKDDAEYKQYFNALSDYFEGVDASGKDISRACFFSYDPDLHLNPDSEIWDKKKDNEVRFSQMSSKDIKNDYGTANRVLNIIRYAIPGERHNKVLKASRLMGGYVASGKITYEEASRLLEQEAFAIDPEDFKTNRKAILDGLEHGMKSPLSDFEENRAEKELEKEETEYKLGKIYYTLADKNDEIDNLYINGVQRGFDTGWDQLDQHVSIKMGATTYIYGPPYSGKSQIDLELLVNLSIRHGLNHAIFSPETGKAADIFIELITIYARRDFYNDYNNKMTPDELAAAKSFVDRHFIVLDPEDQVFTLEDFYNYIDIIERVYNTKIHTTVIDPFNEFKHDFSQDNNRQDMYIERVLGEIRRNARRNDRHNFVITHVTDQQVILDKDSGIRYYPIALPREIAGGQAWYRKGMQMISTWRPPKGLNDENGIPFGENDVIFIIQKSKPKGIGKNGNVRMFYDAKRHSYYQMDGTYSNRNKGEQSQSIRFETPKSEEDIPF